VVNAPFGMKILAFVHGQEWVINPAQQTPKMREAAAEAGVPGIRGSGSGSGGQDLNVVIELGTYTQDRLFRNSVTRGSNKKSLKRAINNLRFA
jgi:hypothetical protein